MLLSIQVVLLILLNASLAKKPTEVSSCSDKRAKGASCSEYKAEYLTAGNSLCQEDHPCALYGETYKWCYTDVKKKNWDYCCTDACEPRGQKYYWCNSGTKWQYCGSPGTKTVKNKKCLPMSPCGLHLDVNKGTSYYWCYVDMFLNYEKCCQPGFPCGKNGATYNWCWTSYRIERTQYEKC